VTELELLREQVRVQKELIAELEEELRPWRESREATRTLEVSEEELTYD